MPVARQLLDNNFDYCSSLPVASATEEFFTLNVFSLGFGDSLFLFLNGLHCWTSRNHRTVDKANHPYCMSPALYGVTPTQVGRCLCLSCWTSRYGRKIGDFVELQGTEGNAYGVLIV